MQAIIQWLDIFVEPMATMGKDTKAYLRQYMLSFISKQKILSSLESTIRTFIALKNIDPMRDNNDIGRSLYAFLAHQVETFFNGINRTAYTKEKCGIQDDTLNTLYAIISGGHHPLIGREIVTYCNPALSFFMELRAENRCKTRALTEVSASSR